MDGKIVTVTLNPVLDRTLTVPHIAFDEMVRATESRLDWGGKGFNVSRALQSMGVESVAMAFIGGATGQVLERGLGDMGIATDLVPIAGETRTNIVVTDAAAERYIKVNEAGPMVQADELALLFDRIRERVRPGDIWVFSGSLPPGLSPDCYAQLVALVRAGGARALLDTSGEPLRLGCAARPYLVKPNVTEVEEVTGRQIQSEADRLGAVEFFLRLGIELVALSLGGDGLLLATAEQAVWARPPRVQVRNPVGAGDALLAGIVLALARAAGPEHSRAGARLPLEEMACWGVGAGTAAAMQEGVGVGTRAEVEALYEQVRVDKVKRELGNK